PRPLHHLYISSSQLPRPPRSTPFPYTTLFRSERVGSQPGPPGHNGRRRLHLVKKSTHPECATEEERVHERRALARGADDEPGDGDRKSTRLNSSHVAISYAVFCLKKKNTSRDR